MDWTLINFWLSVATLGIIPLGLAIWRNLSRIRENDMHEITTRLVRIEEKLDRHLEWHLLKV